MSGSPSGTPPWDPAELPAQPQLHGVVTADVAVVGAGLAGLACAYHLAERAPGLDIAVVDARGPAAGASGRGTGLLGPRAGPAVDRAVRRFGPDTARRVYEASVRAVRDVLDLCARLDVPCGLRPGEQIVAARSPAGLTALARQARACRQLGLDVPVLSAEGVRDRVGVPRTAGLLYRPAATLDPAALTCALARACAAKGVRFYGDSPLLAVHPGELVGPELVFPHGRLYAGQALLAVNSAAGAVGLPVGTVLPLEVYAVATAPLSTPAYEALGGRAGCALVDAVPMAPYFRLLPDGGMVAGGGTVTVPTGLGAARLRARGERAWRWLEGWLRSLHPELAGLRVTHRWSGRIGMTGDDLPVVGPVPGFADVWYIGGCCGHGLALSVAHGRHVAAALLGEPEPGEPLPWHRSRAPRLPVVGPVRGVLRAGVDTLGHVTRRSHR
ncbi:FAD-binding oxidoreductase [Streptomyces griseoviridis]|uniref:Glycine/D-amino acid oxidase-like deaminating enzyme n=3 Tax=Streptomyces TaxID=1883 RepID=A0ABT9L9Z1_STRGD|nr:MULTISPECIES: FAD-binding oxidoreductase [Streptomyces]MDP9680519.1 glycine/D-amino acid oxidase-like deaminating enzyme [Streptomyces griseoviridis]GGS49094.1 oxidoreductase [Streptomyces niveoruber]GGT08459.1 oxidoreductase [Streptomyces griseoviridis]GGU49876.1 oxidoreductase [Streptomyces daghestanicus]GHI28953.1 oxidoreductase [Streptomyces daghestanicus]